MQKAIDLLITRLRHLDGLDLQELNQVGYTILQSELSHYCDAELIHVNNNTISLGSAGWIVADAISAKLVDLLKPLD
jgi:coproporphyrinogen III oxidase-like Fe-S oxidoreductase